MSSNPGANLQKELAELLDSVRNARRSYRQQAANVILIRPELLPWLVTTVVEEHSKEAVKAAWVLELVCLYEVGLLIPHLPEFASGLGRLGDESAIRPASKVCALVSKRYVEQPWEPFDPGTKWINDIVGTSFEWLTGKHKVAAKVFSMETLFHWGVKFEWIHPELWSILDRDFFTESNAYRSRARKIMDKISTAQRLKP